MEKWPFFEHDFRLSNRDKKLKGIPGYKEKAKNLLEIRPMKGIHKGELAGLSASKGRVMTPFVWSVGSFSELGEELNKYRT